MRLTAEEVQETKDAMAQGEPVLQVVLLEGKVCVGFQPGPLDETYSDPRVAGVLLSDMLDHLSLAYADMTGQTADETREYVMGVMLHENAAKRRDPSLSQIRGSLDMTKQ